MTTASETPVARFSGEALFKRLVVGVDGTEPGFEAVRQAARLLAPDGWLELLTAVDLAAVSRTGWSATRIADELEEDAAKAQSRATAIAGPGAEARMIDGPAFKTLLRELDEKEATLAVVGTHGHRRFAEIVFGGVTGELLHSASCSVYVARAPVAEPLFPRAIVAGVDGFPESEAAVEVARYLARRFGVPLTLITALGGNEPDLKRAYALGAVACSGHPVAALVDASKDADLLVVGSRGLHGPRALGSVSERVAHQARCSVLVVRGSG